MALNNLLCQCLRVPGGSTEGGENSSGRGDPRLGIDDILRSVDSGDEGTAMQSLAYHLFRGFAASAKGSCVLLCASQSLYTESCL